MLKRFAIVSKSEHQVDFLIMIDCFSEAFGNFECMFRPLLLKKSNWLQQSNRKAKGLTLQARNLTVFVL